MPIICENRFFRQCTVAFKTDNRFTLMMKKWRDIDLFVTYKFKSRQWQSNFPSNSVQYWIFTMAEPIRAFTFVRNLYYRLGINPPTTHGNRSYNWRIAFILMCLTTLFIISTAFLIFKCDTVSKFGASFYVSITDLLYLIFWTMIIHKMADIFALIEKIDELIAKSKFFSILKG